MASEGSRLKSGDFADSDPNIFGYLVKAGAPVILSESSMCEDPGLNCYKFKLCS